jgi:hypothetical protein
MLHRNAAQAGEDGPIISDVARQFFSPPMEPGADQKHSLKQLARIAVAGAWANEVTGRLR